MSGFIVRIAAVVYLLVILYSRQSSADFWHITPHQPAKVLLPDDPNDPYYDKFKVIPTPEVTATQFMTNFLGISSTNRRRKRTTHRTDNVFVIDGSISIGSCEFERGKVALTNAMKASHEKGRDVKYAAVTFSDSASINFKFFPYPNAKGKLMSISYPRRWTNTQAGLAMARTLFEDFSAGWRVASRKVVLLITDGRSNIDRHLTIPNAEELKKMGVDIYVVAVGSNIDIVEIVNIAGPGSINPNRSREKYLFRVQNLNGFLKVTKLVVRDLNAGRPFSSNCR